jgi:pyruvate dehydrogenase E2 component (dihydrolipoamide acetyltransferase)
VEISVPDLGDVTDVEITDILVKVGDRISPEDPLVSLETEKATVDVPSPAAGSVTEIKVSVGDRVSAGDVLMLVDGEGADAPADEAVDNPDGRDGSASAPASVTGSPTANESSAASGAEAAADSSARDAAKPSASARSAERGAANGGAAQPRPVIVPDLGDFADVEVIEVLVAEGDEVEAEQGLITLETEKAAMDVPAPEPGVVVSLKVKVGDRVSAGHEIARLAPAAASGPQVADAGQRAAAAESRAGATAPNTGPIAAPRSADTPAAPRPMTAVQSAPRASASAGREIDEAAFASAHASPSVRKLARELGVDLGRLRGTGVKGRIRTDDVKAFVKEILSGKGAPGAGLPSVPDIDFAKFGEVEQKPLSRIQRISGARLHASWVNLPHVTQHDEADITVLEETRQSLKHQAEERGVRLTALAFILRACVLTLDEFPHFKSSLSKDGQSLVMKRYTHLGFAVDTKNGLVVPVIRDADHKDIYEIAAELGELSSRARDGKLKPDDMQGGVFTVSSLGGIGGTFFTPIINAPEVAILGVSRHQWKPIYKEGGFLPRLMLPLSLSYDHRVVDGADAVRFTTRLVETLGQVERLLEAIP